MVGRGEQTVRVSPLTILGVVAVVGAVWMAIQLRGVIALCFVVLIVVAALEPIMAWLLGRGLSRTWAAALAVFGSGGLLAAVLVFVGGPLVGQIGVFADQQLPELVSRLDAWLAAHGVDASVKTLLTPLLQEAQGGVSRMLSMAQRLIDAVAAVGAAVFLTFYTLVDGPRLWRMLRRVTPLSWWGLVRQTAERSARRLGAWLRGQMVLAGVVGVLDAAGLWMLGLPSALALGLLAGLLEIVPYVGPIVSGLVMIVAAALLPGNVLVHVAGAALLAWAVQMIENHVLVPKIMQHAVGVSPVLIILAILAGGTLAGAIGAALAVPVVAVLQAVVEEWPSPSATRGRPSIRRGRSEQPPTGAPSTRRSARRDRQASRVSRATPR